MFTQGPRKHQKSVGAKALKFKHARLCHDALLYRSMEEIYLMEFSTYRNFAYDYHATYASHDVNKEQLTPAIIARDSVFKFSQLFLSSTPLFNE